MKKLATLFIVLILFSCKKEKNHDTFVFSYSAMHEAYSLRFTDSDTVFMRRTFPHPNQFFFTVLKKHERDSLTLIINNLDFSKYDTIYEQLNIDDATGFKFYKAKNDTINWIFCYGYKAPDELYKVAGWFENFKNAGHYQATSLQPNFGDLKYIELPEPPPID